MRKSSLFLVSGAAVLIILATAPFINGYFFKRYYLGLLTNISDTSQIKITVQDYKLGWFSSHAKLYVEPKANTASGLTLLENISHGPIVYNSTLHRWSIAQALIENHMFLPEPANTLLLGANNQGFLHINTLAKFNGNFLNIISMPVINMQIPGAGKLSWQGLQGNTVLYTDNHVVNRVTSDVKMGALSVESMFGNLAMMQNTTVKYDINRAPIGLWNGSYVFSMPDFSYNSSDQKSFSVKNIAINNMFDLSQEKFYNSKLVFSMGKLILPDYDLDSVNLKLNVNNLNAQGLINFYNRAPELPQGRNLTAAQIDEYKNLFMQILDPTTMLTENIEMTTSLGNVSSNGKFYFSAPFSTFDEAQKAASFQLNIRASVDSVNKWIELMTPRHDPEAPVETSPVAAVTPPDLDQDIDGLINQNQISMKSAFGLKDLVKRRLSLKDFSYNLDQMVIRQDISKNSATQLKTNYAALANAQTSLPPPKPKLTPLEQMKKQVSDWVSQGYIKQENNDYVTTITRENGMLKINGLNAPS